MSTEEEQLIFIVHTDQYSGNFERQMTAFMTGQVGDCGVGEEYAEEVMDDFNEQDFEAFQEIIGSCQDDHGCDRPCEIWPTPGRYNNGMGGHFDGDPKDGEGRWPAYESVAIYFDEMPTPQQIQFMKDRAYEFAKNFRYEIKITGFEMIKQITRTETVNIPIEV